MPLNDEQRAAFEQQCYGCNINEFTDDIMNSLTYKFSGKSMVLASLLSDAQEMLARGHSNDEIRQQLNRVKYLIRELPDNGEGDC